MKVNFKQRDAFTLVELLVVIAIIGILAGVLIPAVTSVRKSIQTAFLRTECGNLEMAIEAYKLKYGDYPPDFSSLEIVDRHYRRIFPEIMSSELFLLSQLCDDLPDKDQTTDRGNYVPSSMDRGEALVWALGGFSSDPQFPFTGAGGPLAKINASLPAVPNNVQYNISRDNALMEFEPANLTLRPASSDQQLSYSNRAVSADDGDVFPVYRYREGHAPYVYFDSRTYTAAGVGMVQEGKLSFNGFAMAMEGGKLNAVRPVLSDRRTTDDLRRYISQDSKTTVLYCLNYFDFLNPQTFQILSPGLDGVYGNFLDRQDRGPLYWQYPAGKIVEPSMGAGMEPAEEKDPGDGTQLEFVIGMLSAQVDAYNSTSLDGASLDAFEKDNVGSFTSRSFEDDLP